MTPYRPTRLSRMAMPAAMLSISMVNETRIMDWAATSSIVRGLETETAGSSSPTMRRTAAARLAEYGARVRTTSVIGRVTGYPGGAEEVDVSGGMARGANAMASGNLSRPLQWR